MNSTAPHVAAHGFHMFDRGAHVTHWQPTHAEHPVLYSSSRAESSPTHAWRGGIPICAPWFGAGHDGKRTPSHGPARTAEWTRGPIGVSSTQHSLEVDVDATGAPALLVLEHETHRSERSLHSRLVITNTGRSPAVVEAALHSYFAVSDVTQIEVRGLESAAYLDKVTGARDAKPLEFGALVDRVYDDADSVVELVDRGWNRILRIERFGASNTVVWNPGPDAAPADIGVGEWSGFVCVEAALLAGGGRSDGASLEGAVTLAPEATHRLESVVTVVPLAG